MSDEKTAYVLEDGSYSDRRVVGVFDNRAQADAMAERFREPDVTEFALNECNDGDKTYVVMDKEGTALFVMGEKKDDPGFLCFCGKDRSNLAWIVETTDNERAVKVVNEKRAQILAAGLWGDGDGVRRLFGGC